MSKLKTSIIIKFLLIINLLSISYCVLPFLPTSFSEYDRLFIDDRKAAADAFCPASNCANVALQYIKYIKRMGATSWGDKFQGYNFVADSNVRDLITFYSLY